MMFIRYRGKEGTNLEALPSRIVSDITSKMSINHVRYGECARGSVVLSLGWWIAEK